MAPTLTDAEPRGICIACNYPLRGLSEHRCPECGHAFDPANPWTMNMGRPLSPASRWLLTPTGWPLLIAALLSLAVLIYLTDLRSLTLRPSTVELQTCLLGPKALVRAFATWPAPQKLFFVAAALSAAASLVGVSRVLMRWLIAIARRQWRYRPRDLWHKSAITFTALSACLILIFHGYPLRIARTWVIQQLAAPGAALVPAPAPMSRQQRFLALERGMRYLYTPRQRTAALAMLIRHDPASAPVVLAQALIRRRDPALMVNQVLALSLYRRPTDAPLLESLLDHADASVRAAAADALGILHHPAHPIPIRGPSWTRDGAWIEADPPIRIDPLLVNVRDSSGAISGPGLDPGFPGQHTMLRFAAARGANGVTMPELRLARLRRMMLEGPTSQEREAAARATLPHPPDGHALRVTEWAVWRSAAGHWPEAPTPAQEPAPTFIHGRHLRLGARRPDAAARPEKSVIFLSASQPLAVDVEVQLAFGQPYLAYPRPNEAAMVPQSRGRFTEPAPADLAAAPDLYEGYPWLAPSRRPVDWRTELPRLRWQSVIVTPHPLRWMRLAPVPDGQHRWWTDLRSASMSWVSSRGESERFLFYDGPIFYASPVRLLELPGGTLMLDRQPVNHWPLWRMPPERRAWRHAVRPSRLPPEHRYAIDLRVVRNVPHATIYRAPDQSGGESFATSQRYTGDAVVPFFKRLLTDRGLSDAETQTILDLWADEFFARDGRRLLTLLSGDDYHSVCPIRITPAPTSLHRVGVIITELPPS